MQLRTKGRSHEPKPRRTPVPACTEQAHGEARSLARRRMRRRRSHVLLPATVRSVSPRFADSTTSCSQLRLSISLLLTILRASVNPLTPSRSRAPIRSPAPEDSTASSAVPLRKPRWNGAQHPVFYTAVRAALRSSPRSSLPRLSWRSIATACAAHPKLRWAGPAGMLHWPTSLSWPVSHIDSDAFLK